MLGIFDTTGAARMNIQDLKALDRTMSQGLHPYNQALQNQRIADTLLTVVNDGSFYSLTVLPAMKRYAVYLSAGIYTPSIPMLDYAQALKRTIYRKPIAALSESDSILLYAALEDYYREQVVNQAEELEA